ncbi:hypothetical protein G7054_g8205 [Neopestalotiopsis clavispora]|nr:hypothetical protein G7054_g8205 [Neopestalotiopsis clavispora]
MVARNDGAEHDRSTLANLFDKLLWLRDNHGRYSRLDTTEYHFLVAAWRDMIRCGLVDFMYHDLDNRALIEAYHSSCPGLDESTVKNLLRILNSTLEEGVVDHRPAPKFLQDPSEAGSVAPEAGTRGHKRRRSGSSGASRARASVPAVEEPTPSVRVVKLESDHDAIAYGALRTRNRELRKENTDVTAERDGLKARVTVLERLPEEVETLRERDYLNREVIRSKDTVIEALQTTIQALQTTVQAQRETIQNKDDINRNRERDLQEQQAANQELHRQFRTQERLVNRLWDSHMLRRE